MDSNTFYSFMMDLLYLTGSGQVPIKFCHYGNFIKEFHPGEPICGTVNRIVTNPMGGVQIESMDVTTILSCGHTISSQHQLNGVGICAVCGGACCPACLSICAINRYLVCRNCFTLYRGLPVSLPAQTGFWKSRVKKIIKEIEKAYARKQLPMD